MDSGRISVVIPAFNEERRIGGSLRAVLGYMRARHSAFEILVADDGSTDRTPELVAALADDAVRLLRAPANRGKGAAIRRGVAASSGDLVLVTDADLATPIEEIERLLASLRDGADIAIGSRGLRAPDVDLARPRSRRLLGAVFNRLVQVAAVPGVHDTQCGFKLFRGEVARALFARSRIDGFAFDVEVLGLAVRAGYRIAEVPVRWSHQPHSKLRVGRDGLAMLVDLVRVAYGLRAARRMRPEP